MTPRPLKGSTLGNLDYEILQGLQALPIYRTFG
jgi:hypothetical protein